jgi:subfamily B ATP-binding cassette protein MsbA
MPHWRRISGALLLGLIGLAFNAAALVLLAAMTQAVMATAGLDIGLSASGTSGEPPPLSVDMSHWYDYLSQLLNSWLTTRGIPWTLAVLAGVYLAVMALYTLSNLGTIYLLWATRCLAANQMVRDLFSHISYLSMDFFDRSRVGELNSRVAFDTQKYANQLYQITFIVLTSLPVAVFYWIALLRTNIHLSMAAAVAFGMSYLVVQKFGVRGREEVIKLGDMFASTEAVLQESFSGIALVKAYAAEKIQWRRLSGELDRTLHPAIRWGLLERGMRPVNRILQDIPGVLVLLFGAYLILSGQIGVSLLILFIYVMRQVRGPTIELIGGLYVAFQLAGGYATRINELRTTQSSVPNGRYLVSGFNDTLALEGVSFNYEASDVVLRDINLTIRKGEVVALVGRSGAGKSTITNMLLRFYDPTVGYVVLDGRDIRTFQQAQYRRLFGVVPQDTILFNDSVRNNIAYGLPQEVISEEQIVQAAKVAKAHDFITQLAEGYNTIVGDRGLRLSGGQRQRLAIARAVLRSPTILLLDEATSSLDSESELLVQEAINQLLEGRTAIVIAHRLSTIRNADRVVVMEAGRIVEIGSHDELLAKDGIYRRLYEAQYRQNTTEVTEAGSVHS